MILKLRLQFFFLLLRLALLLLFISPSWSYSQDTRIIMVTENWPPFRIIDEAGTSGFRGIDIDIIKKLSESLKINIEIQRHPWARALEQIRSGQADIITGIAYDKKREAFMYYVPISYCSVRPVFYTKKGKGQLVQSYRDLYGPSVGYSINSAYFEPFDSDSQIKKTGLSTETQLLQVLALGRIDVIIGTDPNISYEVSRLGYGDILEPAIYQPSENTELFIAISRKSKALALAKDIEQTLRRLLNDGTIDKIINAYR
jgi:polar amino acid transport system substrate-binding protein